MWGEIKYEKESELYREDKNGVLRGKRVKKNERSEMTIGLVWDANKKAGIHMMYITCTLQTNKDKDNDKAKTEEKTCLLRTMARLSSIRW